MQTANYAVNHCLSGNLTICSRCPNAHHTKCAGSIPPSCPCSNNPYKGLKSTITNGYCNYSTIFQHFSYPLRNLKPIVNRLQNCQNQRRNVVPLQPQNLFQPDNNRSINRDVQKHAQIYWIVFWLKSTYNSPIDFAR
jgi:hypothetical protein